MKQKSQLQKDLARFEKNPLTAPISLQGSISATLVAFEKTVKQYSSYLQNQPALGDDAEAKLQAEKNDSRLKTLTADHAAFAESFLQLKKVYNDANAASNQRNQLFGGSGSSSAENPFSDEAVMNQRRGGAAGSTSTSQPQSNMSFRDGLMHEQSVFERGNAQLDYILEMGQHSLAEIVEQNKILEGVQDKLTKSLRTLNVSEGTIEAVNSRLFKDKLIFWVALALMFLGMYLVLKMFR